MRKKGNRFLFLLQIHHKHSNNRRRAAWLRCGAHDPHKWGLICVRLGAPDVLPQCGADSPQLSSRSSISSTVLVNHASADPTHLLEGHQR